MIPGFRTFFYHYFRCFALFATTGRSGFNDCTFGDQRPHNFGGTCRLFFSFLLSGDQQGRITVTEETEVVGESVIVDGPPVAFDKG